MESYRTILLLWNHPAIIIEHNGKNKHSPWRGKPEPHRRRAQYAHNETRCRPGSQRYWPLPVHCALCQSLFIVLSGNHLGIQPRCKTNEKAPNDQCELHTAKNNADVITSDNADARPAGILWLLTGTIMLGVRASIGAPGSLRQSVATLWRGIKYYWKHTHIVKNNIIIGLQCYIWYTLQD